MRAFENRALAVAGMVLGLAGAATPVRADPASDTATRLADWAVATGDNHGLPFAVIDKTSAEVFVFDADGLELGVTPALVGSARGDDATPGIGDRELSDIRPEERTTPAGRFVASYGSGPADRKVLWVDYATAISLHPVVTNKPAERRPQRLRSPTPNDNRITFGCINVAAAFYGKIVRPTFAAGGIVYILPEEKPLAEVFPAFALQMRPDTIGERAAPALETASAPVTDFDAQWKALHRAQQSRYPDAPAAEADDVTLR